MLAFGLLRVQDSLIAGFLHVLRIFPCFCLSSSLLGASHPMQCDFELGDRVKVLRASTDKTRDKAVAAADDFESPDGWNGDDVAGS